MLNKAQRCNSMSGTSTFKRKIEDTSFVDTYTDPYKRKESPEVFTLLEAITMNANLVKQLETLIKEIPNTHLKIKDISDKFRKNFNLFDRKIIKQWLENHRYEKI